MTTTTIPREADWTEAPTLIEGASRLELTPRDCDLDYWFTAVPQGTLAGMVHGHAPNARVPAYMLEAGPLREAIMNEFAFRSIAEEIATRSITYIIAAAPDVYTMEFFGTQLIDEARHSRVFRGHLLELGVPEQELFDTIWRISGDDARAILHPLEAFALPLIRDQRDFIAGVVILTILVEGVLAPAAELSERKWRLLDPPAAQIERGANIDEIRHLTVGSSTVRDYLREHPEAKPHVLDIITRGRQLWATLPTQDVIIKRELFFQAGLEQHADVVGDYEIWPGKRLIDTTPEERLIAAHTWSTEMQNSRLTYMGLPEAIP
ncbi:MAG: VlmB-like protein [Acidobacteria bacterium]|nr:VlmB-like protein [Acidobacteriota bacterium]MBV9477688.1 VlmB-like protein [Acidobacteriota bacterium]